MTLTAKGRTNDFSPQSCAKIKHFLENPGSVGLWNAIEQTLRIDLNTVISSKPDNTKGSPYMPNKAFVFDLDGTLLGLCPN